MKQLIIFTDLDGTLLDGSTYSFESAAEALNLVSKKHIPLVLCSSKTRTEIEHYRLLLKNNHPFISENGGGIFIPEGYMEIESQYGITVNRIDKYQAIYLGFPYKKLREGIKFLKERGFSVKGFGDMTVEEISGLTGLTEEESIMAKQREFDEPFIFEESEERLEALLELIQKTGFKLTKGNLYHLTGNTDKGRAVKILIELYTKKFKDLYTIALGDSLNDLPMLCNVDLPVVIGKQSNTLDPFINLPKLIVAAGIGPEGWNNAIREIVSKNINQHTDWIFE